MKVHLIRKETVEAFAAANASSRSAFAEWLAKIRYADWETPVDIQQTFRTADLLGRGSNRVVFDIGGTKYRLIAKYWFGETRVHLYIKWLGSHAAYTRLCTDGLQYDIEQQ